MENFETWCWRRTEKISCTDHVRNEVLHRAKKERNILHKQKWKANWIGHKELPSKTCYWKKIEGRTEVTLRRGRRRRQLLDGLKEKRGYWKLKEEALDRTAENLLWKRLWTFLKTRYEIYIYIYKYIHKFIICRITAEFSNGTLSHGARCRRRSVCSMICDFSKCWNYINDCRFHGPPLDTFLSNTVHFYKCQPIKWFSTKITNSNFLPK